jgi:hypothetical protein
MCQCIHTQGTPAAMGLGIVVNCDVVNSSIGKSEKQIPKARGAMINLLPQACS